MKHLLAALVAFLLCSCSTARLDSTVGVGMGKDVLNHGAFERVGALGVRYGDNWKVQGNGGYYMAPGEGQRSSAFGSLQGGVEVVAKGGTYAQVMFGPAYMSAEKDAKLTGRFQFHLSTGAGIKSESGYGLAMTWQHFSNAGIQMPNMGRDLLVLQTIIPLYNWAK